MPLKSKQPLLRNPIPKFIFKFAFFMTFLALLFGFFRSRFPAVITAYVSFTASLANWFMHLTGFSPQQDANLLSLQNFSVEVALECAGVYQVLVFASAVLAFPAVSEKKLWGILLSIPLFYLVDLLRISALLLIGNFHPRLFDFIHLYTGQIFVIFVVLLAWLFWIKKFAYAGKTP
jgi:archaeosortase B (VPXXXP-CTERM-specific)